LPRPVLTRPEFMVRFEKTDHMNRINSVASELSAKGYWPAVAKEFLDEGKYARVVELCAARLKDQPKSLSGRLAYAEALYLSGQNQSAEEHFYKVLQNDPDNLRALKYLGDIKFESGHRVTALSYYERTLQLEPDTSGLCCSIEKMKKEKTKVMVLKRGEEVSPAAGQKLRELPFKTETIGELLLSQGHPRLALSIFRELADKTQNPRLKTRANEIEEALKTKE